MLHFSLSDYDHENERHVEINVGRELWVVVERRVETNTDYLAPDAEVPDDIEDTAQLYFADRELLVRFVNDLIDELLSVGFVYFADGDEWDSDEARTEVARQLEQARFARVDLVGLVEEMSGFPR